MANQKTISINLEFNANTSKAKAQMRELQNQLNTAISSSTSTPLGITPQIEQARKSAMELKITLDNATNVNTGKLNLNKFQAQLAVSGKTLKQYAMDMRMLGPEGVKAFNQVADAVSSASTKLFSLQGGMKKLMDTFANTIRWQIASSAIQGVTSALSETINYAKDLDTSLNKIQIVTNKTADEMARFAKTANQAAKELSTTTTKYTDASLIYFQQGLNNAAVKERTDLTVKLAKVVGEEAATVSEWMTAIWNNFDNGSESLSHYADVLTALGAATASSADEIAGGLEKFAAIAETVGLSYDYAAAALATITAETRQSEDVVGTALKTIFARIENLKLGKILDDGTSLGQYSAALMSVGVNIKDTSGALKDMDVILEELGARWTSLAKDEQIALAQGVAGIRQYNQFIALMDNWNIMQDNVEIAKQANGTLEEQFKIYEDSAEAHKERMEASAESLKGLLLGGEDLKGYYEFMTDFLDIITKVLDAVGGLPTILAAVAAALLKVYQPQVGTFIAGLPMAFKQTASEALKIVSLGHSKWDPAKQFKNNFVAEASKLVGEEDQAGGTAQSLYSKQNLSIESAFLENENRMNETVKQRYEWEMKILKIKQAEVVENNKIVDEAQSQLAQRQDDLGESVSSAAVASYVAKQSALGQLEAAHQMSASTFDKAKGVKLSQNNRAEITQIGQTSLEGMKRAAKELNIEFEDTDNPIQQAEEALNNFATNGKVKVDILIEAFKKLHETINNQGQGSVKNAEQKLMDELQSEEQQLSPVLAAKGTATMTNANSLLARANNIDVSDWEENDKKEFDKLKEQAEKLAKERGKIDSDKNNGKSYERNLAQNRQATKALAEEMQRLGAKTADVSKKVAAVGEAAKKSGQAEEALRESQDNVYQSGERLKESIEGNANATIHWSDNLSGAISGAAAAAMSLQMLHGAFESLTKSMASGNHTWQDWLASIGSITMALMTLVPNITQTISSTSNLVKTIITAIVQKRLEKKATDDQTKSDIIGAGAKITSATAGKVKEKQSKRNQIASEREANANAKEAMTEAAVQVAKAPAIGAAIATAVLSLLAIAGVGVSIIGAISSGKKQVQEEQQQKRNEQIISTYEAEKEEVEKNTELVNAYRDLLNTYNETGEEKDKLANKAKELVEAYKIEGASALLLAEDYNGLARAIENAHNKELEMLSGSSASAVEVTKGKLETSIRQGLGYRKDGQYHLNLGLGTSTNDEDDLFIDVINQMANETEDTPEGIKFGLGADTMSGDKEKRKSDWMYREILSGIDFNDPEDLIWAYNKLTELASRVQQAAREKGQDLTQSEGYNSLIEVLSRWNSGGIEELKAQYGTHQSAIAQNAVHNAGIANTTSLRDYINKASSLMTDIKGQPVAEEAMMTALGDAAVDPIFQYAYGALREQENKIDNSNIVDKEGFKQKLEEAYSNSSEAMIRAIAMTSIDENTSWEDFEKKVKSNLIAGVNAAKVATATQFDMTENAANSYTEALKKNRPEIKKVIKDDKELAYALELISQKSIELNSNLDKLLKAWEENRDALSNGNEGTIEYAKALDALSTAFGDYFDTDVDLTNFIEANLGPISSFLSGNTELYDELAFGMSKYVASAKGDITTLDFLFTELSKKEYALGEHIDPKPLQEAMDNAIETGRYTATELQQILSLSGWTIEFDKDDKTILEFFRTSDESLIEQNQKMQEAARNSRNRINDLNSNLSRYYEIEEIIDDIGTELDKLARQEEKAFGKDKIALMGAQAEGYEQLAKASAEMRRQAELYKVEDQKRLMNEFGQVNIDENGNITNYSEIERSLTQKLINLASNPESNEYKNAEEKLERFKDLAQAYEESSDRVNEAIANEEENLNNAMERRLAALETSIQLDIMINDEGLKELEFKLANIENDAYAAAQAIEYLGQSAEFSTNKYARNQQAIKELFGLKGDTDGSAYTAFMNGDITKALGLELTPDDFASLQSYRDGMIENYEAMKDNFNAIFEAMDGVFEKINEEFDDLDATLEYSQSVLQSYQNIIELAGASTLGISDVMQLNIIDSQLDVANNLIKSNKAQYDKNVEMLAEAREGLAAAQGEEEKKKWEESIKVYEEQVRQSEQDWLSALENGLELSNQRREKAINIAIKNFLKETTGYGSMEELQQIYDQQKQLRDLYVSDYEKAYSLSKLSRQLDKSINDTSGIGAKKQLLALEDRINKAKAAGVKMSSYELQNLEREYQIELAKIALEEAQNAKSTVRLVRNSEGGMAYLYTVDQTALDQAQQKYEDAIYASQKANDEWLNSAEEGLMQATATYIEQLAVINQATYDSEEERNEAIAALNEWYLQQQKFYTGQIDIVLQNNNDLYYNHVDTMGGYYDDNETNFKTMCDNMLAQGTGFNDDFRNTFLAKLSDGLLGNSDSAKSYFNDLVKAIGDSKTGFLGTITAAQAQWMEDTAGHFDAAGSSIEDFKSDVNAYLNGPDGVKSSIDKVNEVLGILQGKTDFTDAKAAITNTASGIESAMSSAYIQINNVNDALSKLITNWGSDTGIAGLPDINKTITLSTEYLDSQGEGDIIDTEFQSKYSVGDSVKADVSGQSLSGEWTQYSGQKDVRADIVGYDSTKQQYLIKTPTGHQTMWVDEDQLTAYDSSIKEVWGDPLEQQKLPTSLTGTTNVSMFTTYDSEGKHKASAYNELIEDSDEYKDFNFTIEGISSSTYKVGANKNASYLFKVRVNPSLYDGSTRYKSVFYIPTYEANRLLQVAGYNVSGKVNSSTGIGSLVNLPKFDTGGYTGTWGPEGRLAMLHQKEIVLNAHDTENILSIVDMVRQMATQLDFNTLTMARGLGNLVANTMIATPQTIDQNVTITAEFPNATNREEIKEAFGDLVNLAAQYASRK